MSPLLCRTPILVSRKQPFIDWANGVDHGAPALTSDLARTRTAYLVTVSETGMGPAALLDEWWPDIFEEELSGAPMSPSAPAAGRASGC
jgi:hypothetical protein